MNISIVSRNVEVTDTMKTKIESTLTKLEKYIKNDIDVNVKIDVKKKSQRIEVTMYLKDGYIVRAEEIQSDLYSGIDLVHDKLYKQLRKYKTKTLNKGRKNESIKFENIEEYIPCGMDDDDELVKRRKKINIDKPMTEEEAIIQMDLIDHNFFIFKDIETNRVNVMYKRDNGYGLLELE